jgi:hypothetical protein
LQGTADTHPAAEEAHGRPFEAVTCLFAYSPAWVIQENTVKRILVTTAQHGTAKHSTLDTAQQQYTLSGWTPS